MQPPAGPFRIPAINDYIPEKLKPWIFVAFVMVFQFCGGGIYLATLNETVGERAWQTEDVQMAGFASLAGMALVFTVMLRLKFRFSSKTIMIICSLGLLLCNLICVYTNNLFIIIATCFVAGIFRMWGTFECNSTIQLWITPKRDMPIFFSYVYLLVQGMVILGGVADMYVALFTNYIYINYLVIGVLLLMILIVYLIFNNRQYTPHFKLLGLDWLGAILWGLIMLTLNFIMIYGEHYNWLQSPEIQSAAVIFIVLLGLNIYRASFIRHPFIALQTFKYKTVWQTSLLYLSVLIFVAPSHLLEHIYFKAILGYDTHKMVEINLISLVGVALGAIFTYRYFAVAKNSFKSTFMIGFSALLAYEMLMYFFIDSNTSQFMLMLPLILRNFGYVVLAIVLLSDLMKVPFQHFFQALTVQAFISAACGSAIAGAILHHGLSLVTTKNFQLISGSVDRLNFKAQLLNPSVLQNVIETQVLMVSLKELYGYLVIAGIVFWIFLLLYRYPYFPENLKFPKLKALTKMIEKEIPKQ